MEEQRPGWGTRDATPVKGGIADPARWVALAGRLVPAEHLPRTMREWRPPRGGRSLWLALAGVALALLVGVVVLARVAASGHDQAAQARAVASRWCGALLAHNYASAWALLSPGAQAGQTAAQFATDAQLHDAVDGGVTACTVAAAAAGGWGADLGFGLAPPATMGVSVHITRAQLGARTGDVTLARQAGGWRVSAVAAALQGTPVGPLLVADHFCKALTAGNYTSAYGDLSARQTSLEKSAANFAKEATSPGGAAYVGCTPSYHTYKITGDTATLGLTINIRVATDAGTSVVPVAGVATLVLENNAWKLDGLDITPPQG